MEYIVISNSLAGHFKNIGILLFQKDNVIMLGAEGKGSNIVSVRC